MNNDKLQQTALGKIVNHLITHPKCVETTETTIFELESALEEIPLGVVVHCNSREGAYLNAPDNHIVAQANSYIDDKLKQIGDAPLLIEPKALILMFNELVKLYGQEQAKS